MAGMKARAVKEKMKSAKSNLKLTFYCKGKQNSVNLGVYRLTLRISRRAPRGRLHAVVRQLLV